MGIFLMIFRLFSSYLLIHSVVFFFLFYLNIVAELNETEIKRCFSILISQGFAIKKKHS